MAYITPDYRQVRAAILRDIGNLLPTANVGADSDYHIRANATGNAIEGLYEHQKWIARQIFADTADAEYLESKHAAQRGITRKSASFATGIVRFSGAVGSAVNVGTEQKANGGIAFVTTASGVIGAGGTVDIAARAVLAGISGNQEAGTALTLTSAQAGVQSQASIVSMTGGIDVESDKDLLARVLFDMRMPSAGGARHDYYKWAMSIAGVTDAYVFTQRREVNSVDVVIETAGGLPSSQLIASVLAYINRDDVRPVGADVLVMAPTLLMVNISAQLMLSGITLADAIARITDVLQAWFATLHMGDVVPRSKLISLMMGVAGVMDVNLISPAANVVVLADNTHSELAKLGTVTLTL